MNVVHSEEPATYSIGEIISFNPATLEELGRVPVYSKDEVEAAVLQARAAQEEWAARSFKDRARFILRARDLLVERQDEICDLIARETGKPPLEALTSELLPVANLMEYFARKSAGMLR